MTLRSRLIILVSIIVGLLFVTSYAIVSQHKSGLMRSLDNSLIKAVEDVSYSLNFPGEPVFITPSASEVESNSNTQEESGISLSPTQLQQESFDSNFGQSVLPLSDVIVSIVFSDGSITGITQGTIASAKPDFASLDFQEIYRAQYMTVQDKKSDEKVRLFVYPLASGTWIVAWRGLSGIESESANLALSMFLGVSSVTVLLLILLLWVFRLGLRPIELVTQAANSVMAGARTELVPSSTAGTEADRLSQAFNLMVSQRDKAEATLRQFVSDASHELRTPLTSFEGLLELVQKDEISEEHLSDIMRRLRKESGRMRELIENLLLLANLDEGQSLRNENVNLAKLAQDAVNDFSILNPERKIGFSIDSNEVQLLQEAGNGFDVRGDELRIHQVVAGLLKNAISHTPNSADIMVVVSRSNDHICVTVADQGPGIEESIQDSVFQRFVRGDQSRSRQFSGGGFGLGLPIARSIIESLGGRLTLKSEVGRGSAFTIALLASDVHLTQNEPVIG